MYSLYFHIPFCRHRCSYCDFNTYAGQEHLRGAYVAALCKEIALVAASANERLAVHTIYFGGGTPSLLSPAQIGHILETTARHFALSAQAEISLEANPGTVDAHALKALRSVGINRLSLGVQSAHPDDLRLLEREHDFVTVIRTVAWARAAGFDNLNLDLMFGLPHQSLERWQGALEQAAALQPEHFSLYALTLEHGTPLAHWVARGLLPDPDPDLAAEMYLWADKLLQENGYTQYEISNWARPGMACRHNLQYWRNQPYLGLGAGAHGYAAGVRTVNVLTPAGYIRRLKAGERPSVFPRTPATVSVRRLSPADEMAETMMMGLRLTEEGVSRSVFARRFGKDMVAVYGPAIRRLVVQGLLRWSEDGESLRLTARGRLLGNWVFREFV
jgi:oxygen-independent coproporphyrinogen-3 oxidase